MEPRSKIILHLYGERSDPKELAQLLQDEEMRQEYEALGEVKDLLDNQQTGRPRPQTIDAIVEESARRHPQTVKPRQKEPAHDRPVAPSTVRRRQDRPAQRSERMSIPALAGIFATVALLVGLGWWHFSAEAPLVPDALSPDGVASGESALERLDAPASAMPDDPEASEIPSWDESDAFRRLRLQLELVQARSAEDDWGEPVIPLEMREDIASSPTLTSAQR